MVPKGLPSEVTQSIHPFFSPQSYDFITNTKIAQKKGSSKKSLLAKLLTAITSFL